MAKDPARYGNPILPGSDPRILKPIEHSRATFQIVAVDQLEVHALMVTIKGEEHYSAWPLAMHPNGYSCHALAERIAAYWAAPSADLKQRAIDQFIYITDCGGLKRGQATLDYLLELPPGPPES